MGESGAMEAKPQAPQYKYKVLIAVSDSPESRAALEWAVENLICEGDQVLLYHLVKTPRLISTMAGLIPFSKVDPEMQRAHTAVAVTNATALLRSFQRLCTTKRVFAKLEVAHCDQRHTELLRKLDEKKFTHLVMGTGQPSKFSLRYRPRKRPSLTARVCQAASCHVILVDKKQRVTFHTKVAMIQLGGPCSGQQDSPPAGRERPVQCQKVSPKSPLEMGLAEAMTPPSNAGNQVSQTSDTEDPEARPTTADFFKCAPLSPMSPARSCSSASPHQTPHSSSSEADVSKGGDPDTPRTVCRDLDLFSLPDTPVSKMGADSDADSPRVRPAVAGLFYGRRPTAQEDADISVEVCGPGKEQVGLGEQKAVQFSKHTDGERIGESAAGYESSQQSLPGVVEEQVALERTREAIYASGQSLNTPKLVGTEPGLPASIQTLPQTVTTSRDSDTSSKSLELNTPTRKTAPSDDSQQQTIAHLEAASLERHVAQREALVEELRQQVALLKEINELRDWELGHVAGRAEALERAFLAEKQKRERAEQRAAQLAAQITALKPWPSARTF